MIERLIRFIRYLQGERPGMGAWDAYAPAASPLLAPILIQQQVLLADVSFYQGDIDFKAMKSSGVSGAIIRAGQRNWVDSRFRENWQKAKEAGIARGSYWFYDSREDPKKQAALWWSLIQDDPGELVHVADLEENYRGAYGKPEHFRTFVQEFQRLSGLPDNRIVIYTGYFWWDDRVGGDPFFKRFGLWLAWYAAMVYVRVPSPWVEDDLLFWQFTSSGNGPLYGVSSLEIDLNWFCCDGLAFSQRFSLEETPEDGETMPTYYKWNGIAANVREGPGASYLDRGDLMNGDVVQMDGQKMGGWVPYKIAQRPDGTPVTLLDGTKLDGTNTQTFWSTDSYMVQVSSLPSPQPTPEPEPAPSGHVVELWIDGVLEYRKVLS